MPNRLIRYDAALLRRFLADGFRGPADLVLLAVVGALALAWLRQRTLTLPPDSVWVALLAGPAGFAWQRLVQLRLAGLAEHSPVAPAALGGTERRVWLAVAQLLFWLPLLAAATLLGVAAARPLAAIGLALGAGAAGVGLASILPGPRASRRAGPSSTPVRPLGAGRRAVLAIVLARQTRGTRRPFARAAWLVAASLLLAVAAGWWGRTHPGPLALILPLLPPLILLLMSAQLDGALLAFLPAAGFRPGFIALAVSALPVASLLAGTTALLLTGQGIGVIAVLALAHLAFILIAIARAWLYPGRTRRSVDFQLQLEAMGLAAAAIMLPPLAVAAAAWRWRQFHNHCRAQLRVQA